MTNCICGHGKKDHTRHIVDDKGFVQSLGCVKCPTCKTWAVRCNEYFRPEPNPERLDGKCAREKGHIGEHFSILMYQM